MSDTKPSNPKDIIGSGKIPLGLIPDTIDVEVSMAFLEGALKYGRYNWRIAGVRASIYREAMGRHMMEWWNGQNEDPKTQVKHLASIIASAGILLDAELCGKLEDDRPPAAPIDKRINELEKHVAHLKEVFKDHNPKQYTIKDGDTYFKGKKIVWCQESTPHNDSPWAKEWFDYVATQFEPVDRKNDRQEIRGTLDDVVWGKKVIKNPVDFVMDWTTNRKAFEDAEQAAPAGIEPVSRAFEAAIAASDSMSTIRGHTLHTKEQSYHNGAHAASDPPDIQRPENSRFEKEEMINGHMCQWIDAYSGYVNGDRLDGTEFWSRIDLHRKGFDTPDEMISAIKNGAYVLEKNAI